jgi:hypothetical protein
MTTNMTRKNFSGSFAMWMAVAALLLLTSFVGSAAAQSESSDRDNPIRITAGEISMRVAPERELYYAFTAGPGEVTLTFDVLKQQKPSFANARLILFNTDAKVIRFLDNSEHLDLRSWLTDERVIRRVRFDRRQQVIMRITTTGTDPGKFRLRLTGAVDLGQATSHASALPQETMFLLPARGAMHVEMNDGTVQQINLSDVRRVTVRP